MCLVENTSVTLNFWLEAKEIVRNDAVDKVKIGLDYFDASINRIFAWVTGQRSMQKALLNALLIPNEALRNAQDQGDFTLLMHLNEKVKTMPLFDVWKEYLSRQNLEEDVYDDVKNYEQTILIKRG